MDSLFFYPHRRLSAESDFFFLRCIQSSNGGTRAISRGSHYFGKAKACADAAKTGIPHVASAFGLLQLSQHLSLSET